MKTEIPSLSYWSNYGNKVPSTAQRNPLGVIKESNLLLLIHGYNNDKTDAAKSYNRFKELQNNLKANLVGVYWPGSNWEGAAYYMQAIGQAKKVAPSLAQDLYSAAKARGYLKIDIIAHSLGCRLTLETINQLLKIKQTDNSLSGLIIGKVVFMAGAVPTNYLEEINKLRNAVNAFNSTLSLYSSSDYVLKLAFPLGQSVIGERFLPVALGAKKWHKGNLYSPKMQQKIIDNAGHSDYWGGESNNYSSQEKAAEYIRKFIDQSGAQFRTIDIRSTPSAPNQIVRHTSNKRTVITKII